MPDDLGHDESIVPGYESELGPESAPGTVNRRTALAGIGAFATYTALLGTDLLRAPSAMAAPPLSFGFPCDVHAISDDWAAHRRRGSLGGTDYMAAYGSNLYAMADGVVSVTDHSTAGSGGRYIQIDHGPMGPYRSVRTESLHLAVISVSVGQSVRRGQIIGKTGESAYGSETGTDGPHVHVHGIFDGARADLQPYVGTGPTAPVATSAEQEVDLYIRRQSTGSVVVFGSDYRSATGGPPGRHIFTTEGEYQAWRSILITYNSEIDRLGLDPRGKKYVPPAALVHVMAVDETGWSVICGMYGV